MTFLAQRYIRLCFLYLFTILSGSWAQENVLNQDDVVLVDSIGNNKICFHRNTAGVDSLHPLIINRIKLSVRSINKIIQVKGVEFRVVVFPERTIPRTGMSGAAPNKEHIYILLNPSHPLLAKSIAEELVATIAHEYHHTLRYRTVGYGSNLFEAMVSEGLADHFCLEVTGEVPPWSTPMSEESLLFWRTKAEKEWFNPQYDHLGWFIGLNSEIPRGTGYELGFRIVKDYLEEHPQERASTLYAVRADNFLTDRQK